MNPIVMALALIVALGAFARVMYQRLSPLLAAKPDHTRLANIPKQVKDLVVYGFLQKRMIDDPIPGLLHIFIFAGFVVVSLRTIAAVASNGGLAKTM